MAGFTERDRQDFIQSGHTHSTLPELSVTGTVRAKSITVDGNTAWHAGNDGAGSGLDADLLDGQHSSAFATSGHTHSYLPLAGGTMTGDAQFSDGTNVEGRLVSSSGTFYVQAGTDSSDTSAALVLARTGTSGTAINTVDIYVTTLRVNSNPVETGAWTTYAPTVTQSGTVTSVTITRAKYCQIGKTVHVMLRIDFTGATGAVGNNPIRVSLPVTAAYGGGTVGSAFYFDTGAAIFPCTARFNSTTSVQFFRSDYAYGSVVPVGQDPNITVANGDWLETTFTYEAA